MCVFSHGYVIGRYGCQSICSALAANGHVVLAVEHRDGSAAFTYTMTHDGRSGELVEAPVEHRRLNYKEYMVQEAGNYPEQIAHRARECIACLSVADALTAGVTNMYSLVNRDFNWEQFKQRVDTDRPLVLGHSFGATTALAVPAFSDRFDGEMCPICKTHFQLPSRSTVSHGRCSPTTTRCSRRSPNRRRPV